MNDPNFAILTRDFNLDDLSGPAKNVLACLCELDMVHRMGIKSETVLWAARLVGQVATMTTPILERVSHRMSIENLSNLRG